MPDHAPSNSDESPHETDITEIELLPDGRICLFGTSHEALSMLNAIQCGRNLSVVARLQQLEPLIDPPDANREGDIL